MNNKKVSIIIPVYTTAPYLKKCVDSVLGQTYQDLEIFLIDDASTDESVDIITKYGEADKRIHPFFYKSNQKPGAIRNQGMGIATGEYLLFVDSDDYIDKRLVENILSVFSNDKDIWLFNGCSFEDGTNSMVAEKYFIMEESFFETEESYYAHIMRIIDVHSPCMKMYKHSFLRENNILFPEGVYGEDVEFWIRCLLATSRIGYSEYKGYYRRLRKGSIMLSGSDKNITDRISNLDTLLTLCEEDVYLYNYIVGLYIPSIAEKVHQAGNPEMEKFFELEMARLICKYNV